ncbi:MAG: alpha-amylase family protein [Gemmatimonadota bacterium]
MVEDLWYKNTVIYSLDLETFLDGNGDGVGDFEGLIQRLDYLQYLGVGAVWLAPFYVTPNRDNGYDVADYYGVDPRHGTSGDFAEFMHQASKRGIRVLIDLVVNHTSDQHRWFKEARRDPDSQFRHWYVWSEDRPPDWDEGMVFPGEQETTWTYDEKAEQYYHHRFYDFQPDLNVENSHVRAEIKRIIGFWVALGVAGFRVDAVPFLIGRKQPGSEGEPRHYEYLTEFRRFLQWRSGDSILLGEANVPPDEMLPYFGGDGGDGIQMMFNFWVNQHLILALATGEAEPLREAVEATLEIPETAQWANFLRNHDELDLGRLSDAQRQAVFARFGPEERMQVFGRGLRRRLAPMLGDRRHEELAYSLMFALPGTPVIRYGDELRMGDHLELEGRAAVRTPMQWANEPNAGFSVARKTVHPVISDGVWSYEHVNVAAQRRDRDSFLNWTGRMIRLRGECPEIGWGKCTVLDTGSPHVLALRHEWRGNAVLVVHNFDEKPHEIELDLDFPGGERLSNLVEQDEVIAPSGQTHRILLAELEYCWYRVGGLDYAVKRERE